MREAHGSAGCVAVLIRRCNFPACSLDVDRTAPHTVWFRGIEPEEAAGAIIDVIERPRAEVYTLPGYAEMAARYYQDVAAAEAQMAQMQRPGTC